MSCVKVLKLQGKYGNDKCRDALMASGINSTDFAYLISKMTCMKGDLQAIKACLKVHYPIVFMAV